MEKLKEYAERHGYYWSCGTHHEWKWDARVWTFMYRNDGSKVIRRVPTNIGFGNTLEEAIEMCISKPKLKFD